LMAIRMMWKPYGKRVRARRSKYLVLVPAMYSIGL
jgi:hypothetical protein